jgi:hypothetical protein
VIEFACEQTCNGSKRAENQWWCMQSKCRQRYRQVRSAGRTNGFACSSGTHTLWVESQDVYEGACASGLIRRRYSSMTHLDDSGRTSPSGRKRAKEIQSSVLVSVCIKRVHARSGQSSGHLPPTMTLAGRVSRESSFEISLVRIVWLAADTWGLLRRAKIMNAFMGRRGEPSALRACTISCASSTESGSAR